MPEHQGVKYVELKRKDTSELFELPEMPDMDGVGDADGAGGREMPTRGPGGKLTPMKPRSPLAGPPLPGAVNTSVGDGDATDDETSGGGDDEATAVLLGTSPALKPLSQVGAGARSAVALTTPTAAAGGSSSSLETNGRESSNVSDQVRSSNLLGRLPRKTLFTLMSHVAKTGPEGLGALTRGTPSMASLSLDMYGQEARRRSVNGRAGTFDDGTSVGRRDSVNTLDIGREMAREPSNGSMADTMIAEDDDYEHGYGAGGGGFGISDMRLDVEHANAAVATEEMLHVPIQDGRLHALLKRLGLSIFIVTCFTVATVVIQLEVYFDNGMRQSTTGDVLKGIISLFTLVQLIMVTAYYYKQMERKKLRNPLLAHLNLFTSSMRYSFLAELLVTIFHVPVFIDLMFPDRNDVDDRWNAFVIMRIYTAVRVVRDWSFLAGQGGKLAGAFSRVELNSSFVLKTFLFKHPGSAVAILLAVVSVVAGYAMYVFERASDAPDYASAIYLILVTMTTVGYGDVAPESIVGRLLAVIAAVLGLVVSALMVAVIHSRLHLTRHQNSIVTFLGARKLEHLLSHKAALSIQLAYRSRKLRKVLNTRSPGSDDGGNAVGSPKPSAQSLPAADGTTPSTLATITNKEASVLRKSLMRTQRRLYDIQNSFRSTKRKLHDEEGMGGPVTLERLYEDIKRSTTSVEELTHRLLAMDNSMNRLQTQISMLSLESSNANMKYIQLTQRIGSMEQFMTDFKNEVVQSLMDIRMAQE